MDFIDVAK